MLDPRFFFEGTLRKEQGASAFLAMALESSKQFRCEFFNLIVPPEEAEALSGRNWRIEVEMDEMDIRLDTKDTVVLIENKISAGAVHPRQLIRYYQKVRASLPSARILAVMVAPWRIGEIEVERVSDSHGFRQDENDVVKHVSWHELGQFSPADGDIEEAIISKWLSYILDPVIEEANRAKYPPIGDRAVIRGTLNQAMPALKAMSPVPLRRWSGKDMEEIYTVRSNLTVSIAVTFKVSADPSFEPIDTRDSEGRLKLRIVTWFKPARRSRHLSGLAQWWEALCRDANVDVPGVGRHSIDAPTERLRHSEDVVCTEDQMVQTVTARGFALLTWVQHQLAGKGQSL